MLAFSACILIGLCAGALLRGPTFLVSLSLAVTAIGLWDGMLPALTALIALEIAYPLGLLLRAWTLPKHA